MADEKAVKLLRQGARVWNDWKSKKYDEVLKKADLSGADLAGANLNGCNLKHANLLAAKLCNVEAYDADLTGSDMRVADLTRATLRLTNLNDVDLTGSKLDRTDFWGARLANSKLHSANLRSAQFVKCDMRGIDLTRAALNTTIFSDVDLTSAIGLSDCRHESNSAIDYQALQRSGVLPLSFLRGVGLPDHFIAYLPSLLGQSIQFFSCFISYSSENDDFAKRLHADLQDKGVRCWFAPHDMPIGGKILDEIDAAIRLRDKVLLLLSEHSITSDWVEDEVSKAFEEERNRGQTVLFPIRLDDTVMDTNEPWAAKLRAQRNIGDFRRWKEHDEYQKSFERVLRDLTVKKP